MRQSLLTLVCMMLCAPHAHSRILRFRLRPHHSSASVSTRHRLTVNSLITEPGTFEWEWYGTSTPAVPTLWKITPGTSGIWGRTELSTGFDLISDISGTYHLTDHVSFAATTALPSIGPVQLAFAPTLTVLARTDSGIRAGGLLLGKVETAHHQGGFSASWSGANHPSDSNPSGLLDLGAGYGYRVASAWTVHTSGVWERSTGTPWLTSISEGVEWQARRNLAFDLSVQHIAIRSDQADRQIIGGVTWNLGRVRAR